MNYPSVTIGIGDGCHGLPLFTLPPAYPANPFRKGSQPWHTLESLKAGPKTSIELSKIALKYTNRVYEIRTKLAGTGWTVKADPVEGASYVVYELVRG